MKASSQSVVRNVILTTLAVLSFLMISAGRVLATPATIIFQDQFNDGLPGWTAVRPAGAAYLDGPMLWCYDKAQNRFFEDSNQYTDSATFSSSRIAVMLINDTVANPTNGFVYTARLAASDNDGFGLIWGFENDFAFYRITFAQQARVLGGWPAQGLWIDRMLNSQPIDIPSFSPNSTFIPTIGQPFDVTIAITNDQMRLTIVDNPLVSPTTFTFNTDVTPITLPTIPNGKVGLMSWGQSGSAAPATFRAFQIQNPTLSPTPLAGVGGSGTGVLTNWSFLITPGGTNTVFPTVLPDWSYGIDVNGGRGTLINHDDQAPNNTAPFTTNFCAPTAVVGDPTWSNYVFSARFLQNDDDGFGMILRYQDATNFYRIAFRNQNAQTGIKRGLTVQKRTAAGDFEQMYSNSVAGFIPPYVANARTPFEVHAQIRTNRLQIIAVKTPDTAPSSVLSDPIDFDITPNTLGTGKVGIFSWAQYADGAGTEVDWVKISDVQGEGLIVSAPFGTPDPPVGLHDFPNGTLLTFTNDLLINVATGVRQTNNGWTGVGSVPASGATNFVQTTITNFSSINWRYITQYLLTTSASAGGSVVTTNGPWVNANQVCLVSAVPNPGFMFLGWAGSSLIVSNVLVFPMARPVNLTANFAPDADGDGLPDPWELAFFGNTFQNAAGDPDGDGKSNGNEYLLGTNPNFSETLLVSDGLISQWTNTCRDPALPGEYTVIDFGGGYRGAFNNNNEFKDVETVLTFMPLNNMSNNVSFQTGRMIVRSNAWNPIWGTNFCVSWECSVGDNDGECFYFRYLNESNWFRVTLEGQDPVGSLVRPFSGLTVQRRMNGLHSDIPLTPIGGPSFAGIVDPLDGTGSPAGFKKTRVTVSATNQVFEVRVIGWDAFFGSGDFNPAYEYVVGFSNSSPSLQGGRIGFANWGQGGFGDFNAVNGIPIGNGGFFDNIVVRSPTTNDAIVFSDNFETAQLGTNLPAGWFNPYTSDLSLAGNWMVNVDGAISQLANQGNSGTGTAIVPKADADAPMLIAPNQVSQNYFLQVGFSQYDNDGVGIVYDFVDTNNFSRVIFRQEASFAGDIPPGLSVSRKSGGVWTDIVAGDPSFLYTPGRPFELSLAVNGGDYTLIASDLENPATPVRKWHWAAPTPALTNRFGITTWASQSAHVNYARAFALPYVPFPFSITNVSVSGGTVTLGIAKQPGDKYHVLSATAVNGPYVTNALNQTAGQYSEPSTTTGSVFYRLQYVP